MNLPNVKINGKERTKDVLIEESISFDSLLLSENTLKGLKGYGFQKPSPIQFKALPLGRCGFDLIVKSKSGTGKTAVFAIIALEMINLESSNLQVLIIAPTREIAVQGCGVIREIGAEFKGLKTSCFIGGLSLEEDVAAARKCQIAVGSPGRIKHLIKAGHLKTDHVRLFVLDEGDKLMESSFQADINEIYHRIPARKQMVVLSATYPDELDKFLAKYMFTPTHVSPETDTPLLLGLKQAVCVVKPSLNVMQQMEIKTEQVVKILSKISFGQCLIFSNFQTRAESVSNTLNRRGWSSGYISGSQTQKERMCAIKDLKEYKCRILLSTDLTARGIDASNVDLVINYDVPHDASTYLHRMGRAGRYGARGICATVAARGKELLQLQNIIGMIGGRELTVAKMPDEIPDGIWEVDFRDFEQVPGIIPDGDFTEGSLKLKNIKSSILDLKSGRFKGGLTDDEIKIEKTEISANVSSSEDILRKLSEGKRPCAENESGELDGDVEKTIIEATQECENIAGLSNTADILKMLSEAPQSDLIDKANIQIGDINKAEENTLDTLKMLSGEKNEELSSTPTYREHLKAPAITVETTENCTEKQNITIAADLNTIGAVKTNSKQADDLSSKRKREHKTSVQQDKRRTSICAKNISLMNVTKLLLNDDLNEVQDDITENLSLYLDQVKHDTSEENLSSESEEKEDLEFQGENKNDDAVCSPFHNKAVGDVKENIFLLAYDCAVNPSKSHWSNFVDYTNEIIEDEKVVNLLNCSDDYEQEDSEEIFHPRHKSRNRKKSWTKRKNTQHDAVQLSSGFVETNNSQDIAESDYPLGLYSYHEYGGSRTFDSSFRDCSKTLEEHVGEFEDVEGFNAWFLQWQQQVHSVRDYVQQNVYLQEMNRYQYYNAQ